MKIQRYTATADTCYDDGPYVLIKDHEPSLSMEICKAEDVDKLEQSHAALLEALEDVLQQIQDAPDEWFTDQCEGFTLTEARAAVAAAKGEAQ